MAEQVLKIGFPYRLLVRSVASVEASEKLYDTLSIRQLEMTLSPAEVQQIADNENLLISPSPSSFRRLQHDIVCGYGTATIEEMFAAQVAANTPLNMGFGAKMEKHIFQEIQEVFARDDILIEKVGEIKVDQDSSIGYMPDFMMKFPNGSKAVGEIKVLSETWVDDDYCCYRTKDAFELMFDSLYQAGVLTDVDGVIQLVPDHEFLSQTKLYSVLEDKPYCLVMATKTAIIIIPGGICDVEKKALLEEYGRVRLRLKNHRRDISRYYSVLEYTAGFVSV